MFDVTYEVISNALAVLDTNTPEGPSEDTKYAVSAMVQAYFYGAYSAVKNTIKQDELSAVLSTNARLVAESWDGESFAYRTTAVHNIMRFAGVIN